MSKFYPDDIEQYSQKELVEISLEQHRCYIELHKEVEAKDKHIAAFEHFVHYIASGDTTSPKWLESDAKKLLKQLSEVSK